jgi:hypothetical protein
MDVHGPWLRLGGENLKLIYIYIYTNTHTLLVDINVF